MVQGLSPGTRITAVATATFSLTVVAALLAMAVVPSLLPGWTTTAVVSGSMAPAIEAGDAVVLRPADPGRVGFGTVVRFQADDGGSPIVHRIVAADSPAKAWVTRGDANQDDDQIVVPYGRVDSIGAAVIPGAGHPVVWFGRGRILIPFAIVAIAAVAALLAFGWPVDDGQRGGVLAGPPLTGRRLGADEPRDEALFPRWSR